MIGVLLDTSAYSAFMRGHPDFKRTLQEADVIGLNPIVLGELTAGFMKGGRQRKNEGELRSFLDSSRVRILEMDEETANRYAVILNGLWTAGTPVPTNDLWIAATAMQHGLRVLTSDAHFLKIPQVVVDYFAIH